MSDNAAALTNMSFTICTVNRRINCTAGNPTMSTSAARDCCIGNVYVLQLGTCSIPYNTTRIIR